MKMENANQLRIQVENQAKIDKFEKMMQHQYKIIKENMRCGKNSILWIFSDKEYFNNEMERKWYNEFYNVAKAVFEENGYSVRGIMIYW